MEASHPPRCHPDDGLPAEAIARMLAEIGQRAPGARIRLVELIDDEVPGIHGRTVKRHWRSARPGLDPAIHGKPPAP